MPKIVFFFGGFEPILRVIVVGTLAYLSLLILLRVSGQRTLTRMHAFDFVITIAIGSTFGRLMTAKGVSLAESVTAFLVLIALQYIFSWIMVRSSKFAYWVTATPSLLYFRGNFLHKAMKKHRVSRDELLAIVRQNKIGSLQDVDAIVLESAGTFAVIRKDSSDYSAMSNLPGIH